VNPKKYKAFILRRVYPERKNFGHDLIALFVLALAIYSWYALFQFFHLMALLVCFILTTTLVKMFLIVMYYPQFRKLSVTLLELEDSRIARWIFGSSATIIGLGLIIIAGLM